MRYLEAFAATVDKDGAPHTIHVMRHAYGGWIWIWMPGNQAFACGWASEKAGGEIWCTLGELRGVDLAMIRTAIDKSRVPTRAKVGGSSCAFRPPEGSE